jgi:hypothetical protein
LILRLHLLYDVDMAKALTAVRLRPDQIRGLNEVLRKSRDEEASVSTLIRAAVDRFLEQEGVKKKRK